MSITSTFTHELAEGFEQYAFPSELNPDQKHFIHRDTDGPWQLNLVQLEGSLNPQQLQELRIELTQLDAFLGGLNVREIRRCTEPGSPELDGRGGGL